MERYFTAGIRKNHTISNCSITYRNSSALNNLGIIYEERGDLKEAYNYCYKAHQIDNQDETYANNVRRISSYIEECKTAASLLKEENVWFKGRLLKLYKLADDMGVFTCTYKQREVILNVKPQKAGELFETFIRKKYIFKLPNDGASKYKINFLIKDLLTIEQKYIEKNKPFEIMGEKLNIDNFESIGYTEELINLIDNIKDVNFKNILKRDIFECAVSVIIGLNKTTVVMCGSMIETILIYIIENKGFKNYNIGKLINNTQRTKQIKNMNNQEMGKFLTSGHR